MTRPVTCEELTLDTALHLARRPPASDDQTLVWEDVVLDLRSHRLSCRGNTIPLSRKPFLLLHAFMRDPRRLLTREALLDTVWGPSVNVELRTIDVQIRRLRQVLAQLRREPFIHTVRGHGYTLDRGA